jgi:hypothetical protein
MSIVPGSRQRTWEPGRIRWGRARFAGGVTVPQAANNVETLHPAETFHAYDVFYFHRMQGFHANGRPEPNNPQSVPCKDLPILPRWVPWKLLANLSP